MHSLSKKKKKKKRLGATDTCIIWEHLFNKNLFLASPLDPYTILLDIFHV